jgi:hypothetical protein
MSTNAFTVVLFYSELVAELLLNMDATPVFSQTDNTCARDASREDVAHCPTQAAAPDYSKTESKHKQTNIVLFGYFLGQLGITERLGHVRLHQIVLDWS